VHALRTTCPLCERVKVFNPKWTQSCAAWDATTQGELARRIDVEGAYQLKLDFITNTRTVGPVEATNMALLLAAGKEDEIVRASFAAQEVPMFGSVLPRPLCEPLQLGRYINFLIEQVNHYAEANSVKALKRALSLARDFGNPRMRGVHLIRQMRRVASSPCTIFVRTTNPEEDGQVAAAGATGYRASNTAMDLTRAVASAIEASAWLSNKV
jgi:hypothetical protein